MTETGQQNGEGATATVPRLTLAEYVGAAGRAVRQSLPAKAWVAAVILDAKAGRAGLSLELVEPFADARNNAFLRCFVGERTRVEIENAIGEKLDVATLKGAHARLLLKPGFHPRYHLEGEVIGLDPTLVESLVARRIEAIRRTLRTERLFDAQSKLPTPVDVTSIAVIHPDKSAGWADVQAELERLQAGGILTLASYPTQFEGNRAAFGIGEALRQILADAGHRPDLILIVRGGGAAAGLASLADLTLARAICCCPVPIVTGLGHASDRTLLDEIAWRAADTPSKSLGVTKAILRRRCEMATADHRTIVRAMDRLVVQTLAPLLEAWSAALVEAVCRITTREAASLRETAHRIECHVIRFRGEIATTQADLDRIAAGLLDIAPKVPRDAATRTMTLYRGIVRFSRLRVPGSRGPGHSGASVRQRGRQLPRSQIRRTRRGLRPARSNRKAPARRGGRTPRPRQGLRRSPRCDGDPAARLRPSSRREAADRSLRGGGPCRHPPRAPLHRRHRGVPTGVSPVAKTPSRREP